MKRKTSSHKETLSLSYQESFSSLFGFAASCFRFVNSVFVCFVAFCGQYSPSSCTPIPFWFGLRQVGQRQYEPANKTNATIVSRTRQAMFITSLRASSWPYPASAPGLGRSFGAAPFCGRANVSHRGIDLFVIAPPVMR